MANARIDIVGSSEIPTITTLYNSVYRPTREAEFLKRRFLGRYNPLMMIASIDEHPIGFYLGFELKPTAYFTWLLGVAVDGRRMGIGSQLLDAAHAWIEQHGYSSIRLECYNYHRPMLHMAIERGYDVVGIRWDSDRQSNLVIFEKVLKPYEGDE